MAERFRAVLAEGEEVGRKMAAQKASVANGVASEHASLTGRVGTLKGISGLINEGRLSRSRIMKAEVLLDEAARLMEEGNYRSAKEKLGRANSHIQAAEVILRPLIGRYADKGQIDRWRSWVAETVRESRERGGYAIIVSKVDRSLTLYKNGKPQGSFRVGLGFNGAREKLHAGDRATPEGRYRIVGKIPKSRYHKALLINYPNEEDRRQFAAAKEKGLIPDGVGIGGLIEIHGGGTEGMTYGCVALANREIDALYRTVEVGTPVTIVGTMDYENDLSTAMKGL